MRASFDDSASWGEPATALLKRLNLSAEIEKLLEGPEDSLRQFLLKIETDENDDDVGRRIRSAIVSDFAHSFDSVVLTHACRKYPWSTYEEDGILRSNTANLIEIAMANFGNPDGVIQAVESIGQYYRNHNDGKVGFLLSADQALRFGCNHVEGPEFLRAIANRVATQDAKSFLAEGTPILIECEIPTSWLPGNFIAPYFRRIFSLWIKERANPAISWRLRLGGVMLEFDVPPDLFLRLLPYERRATNELR
jgi:hypothetical protein